MVTAHGRVKIWGSMCQSMCTHTSHFVTDKGEDNPGIQSYNYLIVATSLGAHVVRVVICFFQEQLY